ncbi:MAG: hypothetical protein ACRCW0_03285 [Clostridium sp.]
MKKRLIGTLIAGIMIFSLVGCGSKDELEDSEEENFKTSDILNNYDFLD